MRLSRLPLIQEQSFKSSIREIMGVNNRSSNAVTIQKYCDVLRAARIKAVDPYQKRLEDNAPVPANLEDLVCEGRVALTFAQHGCQVTMRDSPDLEARIGGLSVGIEVKHFRWKPHHDPVEESLLKSNSLILTRMPNLSETEGREEAWDQMYRFAVKYSRQLFDGKYNLLFFWSSTVAHWDVTLLTAANMFEEALQAPSCDPHMRNLNGMMMNGVWSRVGCDGGSVFWRPIWSAQKPLTRELHFLLEKITRPPDTAFVTVTP